jgi:hypothetical protein
MRLDRLRKFVVLRQALLKEKAELEQRLEQLNRALALDGSPAASRIAAHPSSRSRRVKNPMSLKAAVTQVTKDKPLTKPDILAAIKKLGYQFTAKDPVNSLNTVLYTGKAFRSQGGKYSPAR